MPILFDCPFCSYNKKVPDSYKGKKIKCPRCLATLTLGVPQPTALTALPLPEEEPEVATATAIELDKKDALIECPLCFQLINPVDTTCPIYKQYSEMGGDSDATIIENYKNLEKEGRQTFYMGFASLVYGLGLILGPITVWKAWKTRPLLCANLKAENLRMVNSSLLLGIIGIISSLLILISLL